MQKLDNQYKHLKINQMRLHERCSGHIGGQCGSGASPIRGESTGDPIEEIGTIRMLRNYLRSMRI
jgi:hypothetical protein